MRWLKPILPCLAFVLLAGGASAVTNDWNELIEESKALVRARNLDSAIVTVEQALALVEGEFGHEDTSTAKVLYRLGVYQARNGAYEGARKNLTESLRLFEELLPVDHTYIAKAIISLALVMKERGDYPGAERLARRALAQTQRTLDPHDPDLVKNHILLGQLLQAQSRRSEAEEHLLKALSLREESLDAADPLIARSLVDLGNLYREQARYGEAEPLLLRAVSIAESALEEGHPGIAEALTNLANLYFEYGSYERAEPLYQRALAIWKAAGSPLVVNGLYNLANNRSEMGDYFEAQPLCREALDRAAEIHGEDHPLVAEILTLLAVTHQGTARYDEAEKCFVRALSIWEKALGSESADVAQACNNLAWLYVTTERYAEAEGLLLRSLAVRRAIDGPNHPELSHLLSNLADLYLALGRYDAADSCIAQAAAIIESNYGGDHPRLASFLSLQADLNRKTGRFDIADSLLERSLKIGRATLGRDHPQVARTLACRCRLRQQQGHYATALESATEAFAIRRANFYDNMSILSEQEALAYSAEVRNSADEYLTCYLDGDISQPEMAGEVVFASKGLVTDGVHERRRALVTETDSATLALAETYRMVRSELARRYVASQGTQFDETVPATLDSLTTRSEALEAELARRSASFRLKLSSRRVSPEVIADLMPDNSILVEYLKYRQLRLDPEGEVSRYLAVLLEKGGSVTMVDLGEVAGIDRLVERYRMHMTEIATAGRVPNVVDLMDYEEIARRLYDSLWKPLEAAVQGRSLVLVAPDGGLNMISFAGLMSSSRRYLIEDYNLHYVSTGRSLLRLQDSTSPGSGLFALGDPQFSYGDNDDLTAATVSPDSSSESGDRLRFGPGDLAAGLAPLPGTRREIEQITNAWTSRSQEPCYSFMGRDATEGNFKTKAPGCRVIHLATHGYFLAGSQAASPANFLQIGESRTGLNPLLLSGLYFAGACTLPGSRDSTDGEDGVMTAAEVALLDFRGTELVVLSACETGLGDVREGEGVYGLRRAFQLGGVRTVVSALWPVSDSATAEMMVGIYERGDEWLASTLRKNQLRTLTVLRHDGAADHPFRWGAFVAEGDWR